MSVNGELLVIAISIVALGAASILSSSAHAEEDCLAAPSGRPPPGSQWHYRTDHLKQRKCWHLRAQGEDGETGAAAATRPGAERPPNPPAHLEDQKLQTVPEATAGLRGSTHRRAFKMAGQDRQRRFRGQTRHHQPLPTTRHGLTLHRQPMPATSCGRIRQRLSLPMRQKGSRLPCLIEIVEATSDL